MNISQYFVVKRPIAWTAMISALAWGIYAYMRMPQRQDPIIPVVTGVIITPYPGAEAEKVEQEVTRKIERKVAENPAVEHVKSISRPGVSIVYVELFETERGAELVWQDIRGKLGEIPDLPQAAGRPTQSFLNKDFGDSVAVMLTISSPPLTDLEMQLRARSIRDSILAHRRLSSATPPAERWTPKPRSSYCSPDRRANDESGGAHRSQEVNSADASTRDRERNDGKISGRLVPTCRRGGIAPHGGTH